MNNRKGNNNDSKFLYNSYNSTESLNNTKINSNNISNIEKGKDDDIPNNSRKAKIVFNQIIIQINNSMIFLYSILLLALMTSGRLDTLGR